MITKEFDSFKEAHLGLIEEISNLGGVSPVSIKFTRLANDRIPLSSVGYSSNRWLRYLDNYCYGGRPLRNFLDREFEKKTGETFIFGGNSKHTRGECIISLTMTKDLAHLNFRSIDWVGAGVCDLNLAWFIMDHCKVELWLTCPAVRVVDWQLAGYKFIDEVYGENKIISKAKIIRDQDPRSQTFRRRQRKIETLSIPVCIDEEEIVKNFPRISPEDLSRHLHIEGSKIRDILRTEFGRSVKGEDRYSHSWASFDDPRFLKVAESLRLDIATLPTLDELVEQRLKLFAKTV
jgi:hypothetical protein